jgi:prepilin-type N-terminal cleavage/methylation domain-containing protein
MRFFKRNKKREAGFNLIELMIVIAIIALLIGVGVPAWQAMVKSGNETTASQTLDNIRKFQTQYASRHQGKFAKNFEELIKAGSLDERFKGDKPVINGYIFEMKVQDPSGTTPSFFSVNADPQVDAGLTATGNRHFYVDSTLATIKVTEESRQAKPDDGSL